MSGIGSATSPAAALASQAVKGAINQAPEMPATTLSQLPKQANTNENGTSIVLRPLSGGTCPQEYHLVAGAVCIKDLPSALAPTKKVTPTPTVPTTTSTTKSSSVSTPSTRNEHNSISSTNNDNNNDNSNNEENFHTKILKSFNKEFK